ncbi:MAG: 1-deoxy-D-xylulose-5-phosphate synthase [Clostridia bacterium]|nr:1-deoxy-D-xylulose-5-phosphate synthase [Clostridia bacterium]
MDYKYLGQIKTPDDVKKLDYSQVKILCDEIRDCIIDTVSKNGGHLASNLGVVELTVALHRVFNSPEDAMVFDVGHQSYTHKLLTGRYDSFSTLRTEGGLSGFMRPCESEHDPVVTGHSSNSISAAYGIYRAKKIRGESGTAIAVIGDGALTGGLAFEGINNAGRIRGNFIIVLNDNKMSISHNVGAISKAITRLRNRPRYHSVKSAVNRFLKKIPLIGTGIANFTFRVKEFFKRIVYRNTVFESLGYNYLGPVDGHDLKALESLLSDAKRYNRPSVVHVVTTKGKGYPFAESKPKDYHGVSPFDIDVGTVETNNPTFSDIAGKTLVGIAEENNRICAITAAMTTGTGLSEFAERFRNRFFDVGIAEQHAVTFAAGLSKGGMLPFFAVYSSFLQRGFDEVVHDAAIGNVPIKILVDRAGLVGEDGESHQGVFDVPYLSLIPNVNIYSPCYYDELEYRIKEVAENDQLAVVRYPRGCQAQKTNIDCSTDFTYIKRSGKTAVVTYGRLFSNVFSATEKSDVSVIKLNKIYPVPDEALKIAGGYETVYFYEESSKKGGIGEHFGDLLYENGFSGSYKIIAIGDKFVEQSSVSDAFKKFGFDIDSIKRTLGVK